MRRPLQLAAGRPLVVMSGGMLCACTGPLDPPGLESPSGSPDPRVEARVEALLARMTRDEKIGQMTPVDRACLWVEEDVRVYGLGSVFSGGDEGPADDTAPGWAETLS